MSTFALDLKAFAAKTGKRADEAVGRIVIAISAEIDKRSPVGDATYWKHKPPKGYTGGRFRANWQLGIGRAPGGVVNSNDRTGAATQARIIAAVPDKASGKVYVLANNLPYAQRIENGWSRQAPKGVVGLTAVMFQKIVRDTVAAVPQ